MELLEKELAVLNDEKDLVEKELNFGSLSTVQLVEKSKRVAELILIIEEKEYRWLELSELGE